MDLYQFKKHYWLILLGAIVFAGWWILEKGLSPESISLVITLIGGVFSSWFIIQSQVTEDIRIFRELFTDFNQRYNKLNSEINRIANEVSELSEEDKYILFDYFNLCGEEYLYYKRHFILEEVWITWCKGISVFMQKPKIRRLWDEEQKESAYYGLTFDIIYKSAQKYKL
jgi:hypothetical protein